MQISIVSTQILNTMKKNLLTIGLLALSFAGNAQVLLHVDNTAKMYVSSGSLVYNGGGLQTKGTGNIELYGNMMIQGALAGTDVIKTIDASGNPKNDGGNIVIKLATPASPISSAYGQLYITGIDQTKITAIVDKEYAATKQGSYQQIAIPFYGKSIASFNTDAATILNADGSTTTNANPFNNVRWSTREILKWSNEFLRFDGSTVPSAPIASATVPGITFEPSHVTTTADRTGYFSVGTAGFDPQKIHVFKGIPYADGINNTNSITLTPGTVVFGAGGTNRNIYQEKYNSYIWDNFESATAQWTNTWGKNVYQFSNPYFTNLDLSYIGYAEAGLVTDNNNFNGKLTAISVDPQSVIYSSGSGTSSSYASTQTATFNPDGTPLGNIPALNIRPLGTFKIKLKDGSTQTLNFDNLRLFKSSERTTVPYSVTANRNGANTIKQLGILALDSAGNQIGETYYVVANNFVTGNMVDPIASNSVQAMTDTNNIIQTFEESPAGGTDPNFSSTYRLYINQANEVNFLGKRIDLGVFGSNIASLKFEIREDVALVPNGSHALSTGVGFYYAKPNGQIAEARQGDIIPVTGSTYGVYYGAPQSANLGTTDIAKKSSRTLVTYNPMVKNYIVRFDPEWKSAAIEVFDASGKLVISEKSVKADSDYIIKLDSSLKSMYVVKIVGNDGTVVNSKIVIH